MWRDRRKPILARTSGAAPFRALPSRRDDPLPLRAASIAVLAAVAAVVVVLLGPALIGVKTLTAMDLLARLAPWSDGVSLDPVVNPWLSDSIDFYLPHYLEMRERIWAGELPLASTLAGSGTELLANPNTPVLGPTTAWYMLLPPAYAAGVVKLAETVVAMAGMGLWLRRVGAAWPPALMAGFLYIGSGFFASWAAWSAQSGVAALLPWLFWALERQLAVRTGKSAVAVASIVALLLVAGFPAVAGHGLYMAAGYIIVRVVTSTSSLRPRLGSLGAAMGAVLLGLTLSAVQTVPLIRGLQGVDLSNRVNLFASQLPLKSLITVLYPQTDDSLASWGTNPIEGYAYIGIGGLVLAAIAMVSRRAGSEPPGVVPFLACVASLAASLIWAQGWWNNWLGDVPVLEGNPSPRLRAVLFLCVSALAGIGAHRLFCAPLAARQRHQVAVVAAVGAAALIATAFVAVRLLPPNGAGGRLRQDLLLGLMLCSVLAVVAAWPAPRLKLVAFVALAVLSAVQVSTSLASFWPSSDKSLFYPKLPIIAAAAAAASDGRLVTPNTLIGSSGSAYGLRTLTGHAFQAPSWSDVVKRISPQAYIGGPGRPASSTSPNLPVEIVGAPEQMALLDRMSATAVVAPPMVALPGGVVPLERVDRVASAVGAAAFRDVLTAELPRLTLRGVRLQLAAPVPARDTGTTLVVEIRSGGDLLAQGRLQQVLFQPGAVDIPLSREVDGGGAPLVMTLRANATLGIAATRQGAPDVAAITSVPDGVHLVYGDEHGSVWSRLSGIARIRWAQQAEVLSLAELRLDRLEDPSLRADAVVLSRAGPLGDDRPARLQVLEDNGDRVLVQVSADGSGYLVVADAVQSGWAAKVDGRPAEIVEADHALGAVYVPSGRHIVELLYVGNGLRAGALVSLGGFLLAVAILLRRPLSLVRRPHSPFAAPQHPDSAAPPHPH
jgi:hypothetical protein